MHHIGFKRKADVMEIPLQHFCSMGLCRHTSDNTNYEIRLSGFTPLEAAKHRKRLFLRVLTNGTGIKYYKIRHIGIIGILIPHKLRKTKELFAFLVDRNGAGMTAKQICAVLFPDDTDDNKNSVYLRQLVLDLKNTLKAVGAESVLRHETPCYRVDTSLIQCDYTSYLETGKPEFRGEYMTQYSWAEETCAML